MRMKVYLDGQIVDGASARISVRDHGLLYGDGLFEGLRAYNARPFRLDRHLERLAAGARALHLQVPGGIEAMDQIVRATFKAFGDEGDSYGRLIITRGEGPLGVDPTTCAEPRVICISDRITLFSEEKRRAGLSMITSSVRRPQSDVLDARVKSLNYLNSVLSKGEARRLGADEALVLNSSGHIAEASVANVFALRDGELVTPPTTDGCLDGITRQCVLELAGQLGIPTRVTSIGRMDLFRAREVFLTGTGAGLVRVASLDGERLGGDAAPVFERLYAAHRELVVSGG
jgi:branched-chain amino acid aminotransferase